MNVWIKQFDLEMEVKQKGIELGIYEPDGKFKGDLVVTKARLVWCKGKTSPVNGKRISWNDFIKIMESGKVKQIIKNL